MPRIRTIKPDFWIDEKLAERSRDARLLYIATWNHADDEGRIRWTPEYVKSVAFPYDADLTTRKVSTLMRELVDNDFLRAYDGGRVGQLAYIPRFRKHQAINRPQPSRLPEPPTGTLFDSMNHSVNESRNGSVNASVSESVRTHGALRAGSGSGSGSGSDKTQDLALEAREPSRARERHATEDRVSHEGSDPDPADLTHRHDAHVIAETSYPERCALCRAELEEDATRPGTTGTPDTLERVDPLAVLQRARDAATTNGSPPMADEPAEATHGGGTAAPER